MPDNEDEYVLVGWPEVKPDTHLAAVVAAAMTALLDSGELSLTDPRETWARVAVMCLARHLGSQSQEFVSALIKLPEVLAWCRFVVGAFEEGNLQRMTGTGHWAEGSDA